MATVIVGHAVDDLQRLRRKATAGFQYLRPGILDLCLKVTCCLELEDWEDIQKLQDAARLEPDRQRAKQLRYEWRDRMKVWAVLSIPPQKINSFV